MTTLGRAADGLWVSLDDGRVSTVQIPTALLSREFAEGLGQELADLINTALERFVARVRDDAVEGSADAGLWREVEEFIAAHRGDRPPQAPDCPRAEAEALDGDVRVVVVGGRVRELDLHPGALTVDNRYALESAIVAAVNDALVRHVDADSLPRDKRPVSHERPLELVERIRRHRRSR